MDSFFLDGPAGRLDTRWHGTTTGTPVLVLHPHPLHGGSMGTRLVYQLAKSLATDGRRVVRFDFRHVGRSEGDYDQGRGEVQDALAAYDALRRTTGKEPIVVGFSFGGGVAVQVAIERDPPLLVCISTPAVVRDSDLRPAEAAPQVRCPVHLVYGSQDEVVPRTAAEALAAAFAAPPRWHVVDGGDHFLTPTHIPRAIAAVQAALGEQGL